MLDLLQQPLTLPNGTLLRNRLAKSAMSEALGSVDNHVTDALPRLYAAWSAGGTGLLITGNVMVDRRALGEPNNVALENNEDMLLLKSWAQAGTAHDTACWMQLNHPGKQAPKGLNHETVAPSAIGFGEELSRFFEVPRELTVAEIEDIIRRFGRAAALAKEAGFSGVQIHGAHGYLVSQFLSARHNQRQDSFGGSEANRRRFVLDVYRSIRDAVGADFPVGIKLNSADFQKGGFSEEESMHLIDALAEAGIDLIEISGGTYESPKMSVGLKQSTREREAYFLDFAEKVRARVKTPLMVTGGFRTRQGMLDALHSGALDIIGVARPLAIDPEFSARILKGGEALYSTPERITTGIAAIDRMALMEVAWYGRQLRRLAAGKATKPGESALASLAKVLLASGWNTYRTRRARA
ncbi:MAG: NADH:flavin oxidoreductase/NADH oxidase family protein [Pseudomonadales bacterium]|nr:NADH:flavin oxidoreductase/NADH oxidase family protein [Pseudomonadales bacterium]